MLIDLEQIRIKRRIRQNIGDTTTLKESIKKHGLIYPIIIDKNKNLIAGFRRYQVLKELGYKEVEVKVIPIENKKTLLEIELDENNVRKSFTKSESEAGENQLKNYSRNSIIRFLKFIILKIKKIFKIKF
ncbi:chromosome partitioning protein ParB [Borrelia miyamotoi]|uniref:ParB N-terminal domain-containing protein n=1 Tax=Borrelia miyamotoi TaxID=47466 RepID=A0AAQ3AFS6_9SPIR|nr:ParB N-terminal domain-containing protein [Borrelia miyamotoi]AJA58979.1 chromosome partitioning protein ParB [Borrelia miyamotoi]AOW96072.1 chromosome partitioning protein ParB [Borrelia miyamotoi]ASQ29612.1 chromosome partitioning protein ParB [Borrelia miyamotoi]QTL83810.1 ParB N-terminal domain-containing protein [Borrelia miyamotoi]WAZ84883.1 ParB N-terminal domain-containing protein [Borrelia miyamotoi]